jgi:hypothetical protein
LGKQINIQALHCNVKATTTEPLTSLATLTSLSLMPTLSLPSMSLSITTMSFSMISFTMTGSLAPLPSASGKNAGLPAFPNLKGDARLNHGSFSWALITFIFGANALILIYL